jgi:hypothetical protein
MSDKSCQVHEVEFQDVLLTLKLLRAHVITVYSKVQCPCSYHIIKGSLY